MDGNTYTATDYINSIINNLEKGSTFTNSPIITRDVINKITEFTNFLNKTARVALSNANPQDRQELVNVIVTLKKSMSELELNSVGDSKTFEGILMRKHEWVNATTKATFRCWLTIYCIIRDSKIVFYDDEKTAKSKPEKRLMGEPELSLKKAVANVARDYTKRNHVFRLKLESGCEYLFQAQNDNEMNTWISNINYHANAESTGSIRSPTLPGELLKPKDN